MGTKTRAERKVEAEKLRAEIKLSLLEALTAANDLFSRWEDVVKYVANRYSEKIQNDPTKKTVYLEVWNETFREIDQELKLREAIDQYVTASPPHPDDDDGSLCPGDAILISGGDREPIPPHFYGAMGSNLSQDQVTTAAGWMNQLKRNGRI